MVKAVKIVFAQLRLLKKVISDAGMKLTSQMFRQFASR